MISDNFRVTGAHDTVLDYADLFSVTFHDVFFRNSIRDGTKFYCLSKIPSDDILEGLYKLRVRESDQLITGLGLYDMETHQKYRFPPIRS